MQQPPPINQHYQRPIETPEQTAARIAAARQKAAMRRKAEAEKLKQKQKSRVIRMAITLTAIALIVITFFAGQYAGTERGHKDARQQIEQENDLSAGPKSLI